jgi:mannose-6-phosphate isomerase-like protein (cupin superfamily)
MVPEQHAVEHFSLTELELAAGQMAEWPPYPHGEKVWHILNGAGLMTLGLEQFAIVPGDIIHIAPGLVHQVHSRGQHPLQLLCISCPAHHGKHDAPEEALPNLVSPT